MKIDTRTDVRFDSSRSSTDVPSTGATSFSDLFALASAKGAEPGTSMTTTAAISGKTESAYETAARELHEYLQKTPEQRMREAILKKMGLTEEDIAKMPLEQQNVVEAAIKEKIKEALLARAHADGTLSQDFDTSGRLLQLSIQQAAR